MSNFAVLDTETNWENAVMSLGVIIAGDEDFRALDRRYYIFDPEYCVGGMFSAQLFLDGQPSRSCFRETALGELRDWLRRNAVERLFAYNARFDFSLLPELRDFRWYDIMGLAAYRQYNRTIPPTAECCASGRLKRGYGVEPTLRRLTGNRLYFEKHNALCDAEDELAIMRLLGHALPVYERTAVN